VEIHLNMGQQDIYCSDTFILILSIHSSRLRRIVFKQWTIYVQQFVINDALSQPFHGKDLAVVYFTFIH